MLNLVLCQGVFSQRSDFKHFLGFCQECGLASKLCMTKQGEGTYFSTYVCVWVVYMSAIGSHSLEIAAEIKESNKRGEGNLN